MLISKYNIISALHYCKCSQISEYLKVDSNSSLDILRKKRFDIVTDNKWLKSTSFIKTKLFKKWNLSLDKFV